MSTQKVYGDADFLGTITGAGGGGAAETWTTQAMTFPVDPASSLVVPPGTIFTNQTEIDDFLAANAATHFKYVMDCFDSLPHDVYHPVYFELSPGVHRPRNPEPCGDTAAWCFTDYPGQPRHHRFHRSPQNAGGFLSLTSIAYDAVYWTDVLPAEAVVGVNNSPTYNRYIDVAPATYTPGALRGKYARIDSSPTFPLLIKDNTDSRIYIMNNISGVPTTVAIQKQGIIFRNSYDDVNPAVNKPLIYVRAEEFLEFGKTLVTDSILFEQYDVTQKVIWTSGRVYHDMFMCGVDQADMKDNGIDSRGSFIYHDRGGFHGQLWRCFYRGQRDAAVPNNNSQVAFSFSADQNPLLAGRWPCPDSLIRGSSQSLNLKGMILLLSNTCFANFTVPPLSLTNCDLNAGNACQFIDCTSRVISFVDRNRFTGSFHTYFDNIGPSTSAHLFYIQGDDNFLNWGGSNVFVGPNANTGRLLYFQPGSGNRVLINVLFADGVLTTGGNLWFNGLDMDFAEIDTLLEAVQQPDGVMAGIVHVLNAFGSLATPASKTLSFNTAGNLLSFDSGTGVDISGLGVFTLAGTSGASVVVAVSAVPGSNQAFSLPLRRSRGIADYRQNVISKVS